MAGGRLLLGATPLGQPSDASARLVSALGSADIVAAEDTRRVRTLATALGVRIGGRVVSLFDQNEAARVPALLEEMNGGRDGSCGHRRRHAAGQRSGVSAGGSVHRRGDPGDVPARPVGGDDGAGALWAALGEVLLRGLRAAQESARRTWLAALADRAAHLCVLRVAASAGGVPAPTRSTSWAPSGGSAVCRELTKTHEEVIRGSLAELAEWAEDGVLGEITVVLAGATPQADVSTLVAEVHALIGGGMRVKDACPQVVAAHPGAPSRRELYDAVLRSRRRLTGADDRRGLVEALVPLGVRDRSRQ